MTETLEEKKAIIKNKGYEILSDLDKINYDTQIIIRNKEGYIGHLSYKSIKNGSEPLYFSLKNNKDFFIYNLNLFCFYNKFRVKVLGFADEQKWADTGVKCQCECGNIFKTSYSALKRGEKTHCNNCSTPTSSWCKKVEQFLNKKHIKFTKEVKFEDCKDKTYLPFDYQINAGLIEVDGEQHESSNNYNFTKNSKINNKLYSKQKKHDIMKDNYCKEHNIKLLRINYKDILDGSYENKIMNFINPNYNILDAFNF